MKDIIVDNEFKNVELVGGKAYNLNILKNNNLNVPNFFVISSKMYELYINGDLDCEYVEDYINKYCNEHFKEGTLFAIRSSANVEDSSTMSYAGQFQTFLNVKQEDVFESIKKCWEYAKNKFKKVKSEQHFLPKMAVVVQEMVASEISGIAFTANPEGLLNEAVITAGRGLGNNVVEDKIATITYYYNLNDDIYYFEKQDGAIELSKNNIEKIVGSLKTIQKNYNKDMDVEWAMIDGQLFILQARPITTFVNEDVIVLDNSNIVENYPNINLPLTCSSTQIFYRHTFYNVFIKLLGEKEIKKHLDIFQNVVDSVNGRIYYRISNWYTFFQFLPFSNKIIKIWQDMLGVVDKKLVYSKKKIGFTLKIKLLINAVLLLLKNNKNMSNINNECKDKKKQHTEKMLKKQQYSNLELLKIYEDVTGFGCKLASVGLVNDMNTFIWTSAVKSLCKNKSYEKEINKYISNISNLESMKTVLELNEIIKNIRKDKKLYFEFIKINSNDEFYKFIDKYKNNSNNRDIKNYIYMYGDRVLEELKWETKTYSTDPILLVERIKNYNVENFASYESIGRKKLSDTLNVKGNLFLKYAVKHAANGIAQRELSRLNRTVVYGMSREVLLQIGENLFNNGILDSKEDIFYLKYEELQDYINGKSVDLKVIVETRKTEYKEFEKIPAYSRLVFAGKVFNKRIHTEVVTNYETSNLLTGTPVSSGEATAECLVIDDIKNIGDVKNKILVTKSTDPGWAFILKDAAGLVAERGSLLSHTAIISRELGIPAVVNVKNATNILKNGDKIKLDANKGEIEICAN